MFASDSTLHSNQPHFHTFVNLTVIAPDGLPIMATTWFAAQGDEVFVRMPPTAALLTQVRDHGRVTLQPATRAGESRGLTVAGRARIVPQFETTAAQHAFAQKYGLAAGLTQVLADDQGLGGEVWLAITVDSGPGAAELLLPAMPAAQRYEQRKRSVLLSAAGIGLGGLIIALNRWRRGAA